MTPEQEQALYETNIARGKLAKQLRDNPLLQEVIIGMKAEVYEKFESTKAAQAEERNECWRQLHAVLALEGRIKAIWEEGERSIWLLGKIKKRIKNVRQAIKRI